MAEYPFQVGRFKVVGTGDADNMQLGVSQVRMGCSEISQHMDVACSSHHKQFFQVFFPCRVQCLEHR